MTWKSSETSFRKYKKYWWKNQDQGAHTLSTRWGARAPPLGAPPCLVGPLQLRRPQLQLHIFRLTEKKIRQEVSSRFTIWSRCSPLFFLGRVDLESVLGSGEGKSSPSSSSTILHHQFHDAHRHHRLAGRWWVGWDLPCNRVSFVMVWSLVSTMF